MSERKNLEQAIAAMEAQRATLGSVVVDDAIATLRQKLKSLQPKSMSDQYKLITLMAVQIKGLSEVIDLLDSETAYTYQQTLLNRWSNCINEHNGQLYEQTIREMLVVWGIQTTYENDQEQAIHAGLALVDITASFNKEQGVGLEIQLQIGISTGRVMVREEDEEGSYTLIGSINNVIYQLAKSAAIDQVIVTKYCYQHVRGQFELIPHTPLILTDQIEPIHTYCIIKARQHRFDYNSIRFEGMETRTIGREYHLARLKEAMYTVTEESELQVVTVVGEAGVGKSRLLFAFEQWLDTTDELEVRYFKGRTSQHQAAPFRLLRNLFSIRFNIFDSDDQETVQQKFENGIMDFMGKDSQECVHFIGYMLGLGYYESPYLRPILENAQQIYDRAIHHFHQFFQSACEDMPAIILFEDIHWADHDSLNVIDYLARFGNRLPILVLCTARRSLYSRRPQWGKGREQHQCLELKTLSKKQMQMLIRELLQKVVNVPSMLVESIIEKAGGNPFYAEEIVKMMLDQKKIVRQGDSWDITIKDLSDFQIPSTLTGVLQTRLDTLSMAARILAQQAAVIGRVFWDEILKELAQKNDSFSQVYNASSIPKFFDEREQLEQLYKKISKAFSLRELKLLCFELQIEYDDVPGDIKANKVAELIKYCQRRHILRELLQKCQQKRPKIDWFIETKVDKQEEIISSSLAELEQREIIVKREMATFEHMNEYIFQHALLHQVCYESVLKSTRKEYHIFIAEWLIKNVAIRINEHLQLIAQHYHMAAQAQQAANWYDQAGQYAAARFAHQDACTYFSHALQLTPISDVARKYELLSKRERIYHLIGLREPQGADLDQLMILAGTDVQKIEIGLRFGWYYSDVGNYDAAISISEQVYQWTIKNTDSTGQAEAILNCGWAYLQKWEHEMAIKQYQRAFELAEVAEAPALIARALGGLGRIALRKGEYAAAIRFHKQALNLRQKMDNLSEQVQSISNLGQVAHAQSDYDAARNYYREALQLVKQMGDLPNEARLLCELGRNDWRQGLYPEAKSYFLQSLALAKATNDRLTEATSLRLQGSLESLQGNYEIAANFYNQGLDISLESGDRAGEGAALNNLGLVADSQQQYDKAVDYYTSSLKISHEIGDRLLAIYTRHYID